MHIHKFIEQCRFKNVLRTDSTFGSFFYDCTEKIREYLFNIHPKQIIGSTVEVPLYEVVYSYTTVRGNSREGKKYFFSSCMPDNEYELEIMAQPVLERWVDEENRRCPYRAIGNVEILSVSLLANAEFCLN